MENETEKQKKMEKEMETGIMQWFIGWEQKTCTTQTNLYPGKNGSVVYGDAGFSYRQSFSRFFKSQTQV